MRAVRDDLLRCAGEVPPSGFAYLDGGYAANLEAFLHNEERARRNWTLEALGTNDGLSLTHLNNRRARYEKYWRSLVTQVRAKYSGLVSYGANFDQFHEVGFWDALDVLAVNAYFPLSLYGLDSQKRLAHMATAWRTIAANLSQVGDARPVVLIELGWTRRLGSTVRPYSYESVEVLETAGSDGSRTCVHWGTQPNDAGERVAALQALANVIRDGDFQVLNGFTLWKLTTRPEHRTIEPFAALLQPGSGYPYAKWQKLGTAQNDKLDAAYIGLAASIANEVQARSSRSHNGIIDVKEHQGELGCTSFEE